MILNIQVLRVHDPLSSAWVLLENKFHKAIIKKDNLHKECLWALKYIQLKRIKKVVMIFCCD